MFAQIPWSFSESLQKHVTVPLSNTKMAPNSEKGVKMFKIKAVAHQCAEHPTKAENLFDCPRLSVGLVRPAIWRTELAICPASQSLQRRSINAQLWVGVLISRKRSRTVLPSTYYQLLTKVYAWPTTQASVDGHHNLVTMFSHQKRRNNFNKNYEHLDITKLLLYASTFKFDAL